MTLKELSPAARQAAASKTIRGEWEYAAYDRLLGELIAYDTVMDARAAFLKKWMIGAIAFFFVAMIAGLVLVGNEMPETGVPLILLAAAHLVGSIWYWRKSKRESLPEEALAMLRQVFRQVRQDLDPMGRIGTEIDLSGPTKQKRGPEKVLPKGRFHSQKQWVYADPWCQLRLPLRDGSVVTIRQADQLTEQERVRRNSRGKYKTKTKYRKLCRVTATLNPPKGVELATPPKVDANWERFRVDGKKGRPVAVLDRWFLYKQAQDKPAKTPAGAEIVGMLFRLCSMRPVEAR